MLRSFTPRRSRMATRSTGFSLLEILLVLGVAAALIIGAFVIYPKAQNAQRVIAEQNNLNTIAANLRAMYGSQPNYSDLGNSVAIAGKIYPESMVNTALQSANNTWGGDVSVNSGGSLYTNGFQIDYAGIPSEPCVKLTSAAASYFALVYVNGTMVKNLSSNVNLDVGTLANACASVTNSITFFDR